MEQGIRQRDYTFMFTHGKQQWTRLALRELSQKSALLITFTYILRVSFLLAVFGNCVYACLYVCMF